MCLELGIETGEDIEISTKEGKARATVKCVSWISGRSAFMPFHWGRVNRIMDWKVDPISKEPAYKLLKASLKKNLMIRGTSREKIRNVWDNFVLF